MPTTFFPAHADVSDLVQEVCEQYHGDLFEAKVTIGCMMAVSDNETPLKLHGYPCLAIIKINSAKLRAEGLPDATITFNGYFWSHASDAEKRALVDHELTHLTLRRDKKTGEVLTDGGDRPKLRMRLHDQEIGVFHSIVDRHKEAAPDFDAMKAVAESFHQLTMNFVG